VKGKFVERAFAKLNLYLSVVGIYDNGYHELEMLTVSLQEHDLLEIEICEGEEFLVSLELRSDRFDALRGLSVEENLMWKALKELSLLTTFPLSVSVCIDKNLPSGGGLGGGSSDAAAVVRAAIRYLGERGISVDVGRLETSLMHLGADILYFLNGGVRFVSGVGERLASVPKSVEAELYGVQCLLLVPEFSCATSEIFAVSRKMYRSGFPSKVGALPERLESFRSGQGCRSVVRNDLLYPASSVHPQLLVYFDVIKSLQGVLCGMTGSGSTLFVIPEVGKDLPPGLERRLRGLLSGKNFSLISTELLAFEPRLWETITR